jgi:hypothetical protein
MSGRVSGGVCRKKNAGETACATVHVNNLEGRSLLVGGGLLQVRQPDRALALALAEDDFVLRHRQAGGPYM